MPVIQDARITPVLETENGLANLCDAVIGLVAAFKKNGQAWSDPLVGRDGMDAHVSVATPCIDSFDVRYNSEWVSKELERFREHAVGAPVWTARGNTTSRRTAPQDWGQCASFYLFTHAFDETSPLCAGDDGEAAPLYLLSLEQQLRQELVFWMSAYKHHDYIWLQSGALELAAYSQLADIGSELSRRGRALAAEVEDAVKKPTYLYLHRYHAIEQEAERSCPGCGGTWKQPADVSSRGLAWFDFRCEPCRLVSHIGVSSD